MYFKYSEIRTVQNRVDIHESEFTPGFVLSAQNLFTGAFVIERGTGKVAD
jgi:hypothetical protein